MAKTKSERKERKKAKALAEAKKSLFEANGLTPPSLRPHDEEPASRTPKEPPALSKEPALRTPEEDTSRLSSSSEEAVMDTSLSAQAKESAAVDYLIVKPIRPPEPKGLAQ